MAQKNLIMGLALVVLVLVVGGFFLILTQLGEGISEVPAGELGALRPGSENEAMEEETLPPASGNIDDAVNLLLQDAENESLELAGEESDTALVTSDSQAITEFGQSNDESQL